MLPLVKKALALQLWGFLSLVLPVLLPPWKASHCASALGFLEVLG